MTPEPAESRWWPAEIGRLELDGSVGLMFASYVDPLDGREYQAGREQGGRRRGWWVQQVVEDTRSGGYRSFDPADQDAAIRKLRAMASADVGVVMLVLPIAFYLPAIVGTDGAESAEAAGTFIGSIAGLFIWGFVFLILAIVVAAIGYVFKRRASKKLNQNSA